MHRVSGREHLNQQILFRSHLLKSYFFPLRITSNLYVSFLFFSWFRLVPNAILIYSIPIVNHASVILPLCMYSELMKIGLVVNVPLFKALARPQKDSITWMHISTLASYSHSHSWLYISIISPINMTVRISSKCILYCLFISRLITFFILLSILFIIVYILSFYFVIFIF